MDLHQNLLCIGILSVAHVLSAQLSSSHFEPAPIFTETFAGGAPVGLWELDPGNLGGAAPPAFVTSTPPGVDPIVASLDPVASSSDGGCMMIGNPASTNGELYGLDYIRCINADASGTGLEFTAPILNKYRVVAKLYLYSAIQKPQRWQVGPYLYGGLDLFRACAFYNTNETGVGPGFGWRGATQSSNTLPGTSPVTSSGWYLMSVMVDSTAVNPIDHKLAICVDANGDGILNESDPLEYIALTLYTQHRPQGPFGIFAVGEVNSDWFPLFVDTVELYLPQSQVADWKLY